MKILVPHRHIHRCERWRTAVWGSTGRVVHPQSWPFPSRDATPGCQLPRRCWGPEDQIMPCATKTDQTWYPGDHGLPGFPPGSQSWWWNHPPNESHVWTWQGGWLPAPHPWSWQRPCWWWLHELALDRRKSMKLGVSFPDRSSSNNGFTRQNDATSGCKQQKRSFFLDLPNENYWLNPKQHWSAPSSIHPQLPLPGGGQGGQKNQRMVVCCSLLDEKAKKKVLGKQWWCEFTSICFTELPHLCKAVLVLKSYGVWINTTIFIPFLVGYSHP